MSRKKLEKKLEIIALSLDKKSLLQYISAVSGRPKLEKQLRYAYKIGECKFKIWELQDHWFGLYPRKYDNVPILPEMELPFDGILFDLDSTYTKKHNCGSCEENCSDFLYFFIENDTIFQKMIISSVGSHFGIVFSEEISWKILEEKRVNFIELTLIYQSMILDVCEKFGYITVLKQIKKDQNDDKILAKDLLDTLTFLPYVLFNIVKSYV